MGGKFHLKLNTGERPIANKYREGKMQRTLKRELKVLEIVKREAMAASGIRLVRDSAWATVAAALLCAEGVSWRPRMRWWARVLPGALLGRWVNISSGLREEAGREVVHTHAFAGVVYVTPWQSPCVAGLREFMTHAF